VIFDFGGRLRTRVRLTLLYRRGWYLCVGGITADGAAPSAEGRDSLEVLVFQADGYRYTRGAEEGGTPAFPAPCTLVLDVDVGAGTVTLDADGKRVGVFTGVRDDILQPVLFLTRARRR
jgi:hypothetical protein